jgi:hypothetical protein
MLYLIEWNSKVELVFVKQFRQELAVGLLLFVLVEESLVVCSSMCQNQQGAEGMRCVVYRCQ